MSRNKKLRRDIQNYFEQRKKASAAKLRRVK